MRFMSYTVGDQPRIAFDKSGGGLRGISFMDAAASMPILASGVSGLLSARTGETAVAQDQLRDAPSLDPGAITLLPPLLAPGETVCIGLNCADHAAESGFVVPSYPTVFGRFASGLIGHGATMVVPRQSPQLDFEGELLAVIGRGGRNIPAGRALEHVAHSSIFNDGSIRGYQLKSPQRTVGKNFDDTDAFGPSYVPAAALPPGTRAAAANAVEHGGCPGRLDRRHGVRGLDAHRDAGRDNGAAHRRLDRDRNTGRRRHGVKAAIVHKARRHLRGEGRRDLHPAQPAVSGARGTLNGTRRPDRNVATKRDTLTQIGGFNPASADRDTQAGVHSTDHFVIAEPDLAEVRRFYDQFGLDVRDEGRSFHIRAFGHAHRRTRWWRARPSAYCTSATGPTRTTCRGSASAWSR